MPERSNGAVSKTVEPLWVPGVRIPLSPPQKNKRAGKAGNQKAAAKKSKFICFFWLLIFWARSAAFVFL